MSDARLPIEHWDSGRLSRDKINNSFNEMVERVEWYRPHIKNWVWWIWETNTWVQAEWYETEFQVAEWYIQYKTQRSSSWNNLIAIDDLKWDKGDAFTYDDFTPEQLEALTWPQWEPWTPWKDWEDWYTPIKWVDYFTQADIESLNIPTKLSDLSNDEWFINNTVNNLVNYYKKSELYTQDEIDELLGDIVWIKVEIVQTLPQIWQNGVIYFVPNNWEGQNVYDEYIRLESQNKFEKIWTTEVDLSNYYTKAQVDNKLSDIKQTIHLPMPEIWDEIWDVRDILMAWGNIIWDNMTLEEDGESELFYITYVDTSVWDDYIAITAFNPSGYKWVLMESDGSGEWDTVNFSYNVPLQPSDYYFGTISNARNSNLIQFNTGLVNHKVNVWTFTFTQNTVIFRQVASVKNWMLYIKEISNKLDRDLDIVVSAGNNIINPHWFDLKLGAKEEATMVLVGENTTTLRIIDYVRSTKEEAPTVSMYNLPEEWDDISDMLEDLDNNEAVIIKVPMDDDETEFQYGLLNEYFPEDNYFTFQTPSYSIDVSYDGNNEVTDIYTWPNPNLKMSHYRWSNQRNNYNFCIRTIWTRDVSLQVASWTTIQEWLPYIAEVVNTWGSAINVTLWNQVTNPMNIPIAQVEPWETRFMLFCKSNTSGNTLVYLWTTYKRGGNEVEVSDQDYNIFTSGMKIWWWEDTDLQNLSEYDGNTLYLSF